MQLAEMTWPQIQSLDKDTPVIIPVAALEQHGHHLPVFTDSMLLGEIIKRLDARIGKRIVLTPLMWLGNSDHHLDFPGTLSAAPRVYLDLLVGLYNNLITHGFRRILMLNGHGGNDVPGKQAVFEVRQQHRHRNDLLLLFGTYWSLEHPDATKSESPFVFEQHEMGHACEWETSMILRIAPQLVGDYRATQPVPFGSAFRPAYRGWITKERTTPGHIGSPHLASAEKGEVLFERFTQHAIQLIDRIEKWDGKSWTAREWE